MYFEKGKAVVPLSKDFYLTGGGNRFDRNFGKMFITVTDRNLKKGEK